MSQQACGTAADTHITSSRQSHNAKRAADESNLMTAVTRLTYVAGINNVMNTMCFNVCSSLLCHVLTLRSIFWVAHTI
jgi:hypothetical protein